jgi:hypothetical protein
MREALMHDAGSTPQPVVTADIVAVFAFNPARGDFESLPAVRRSSDAYELLGAPGDAGYAAGDLVRCELSDGELIVRGHAARTPLA